MSTALLPIPSYTQIRQELTDAVLHDLLGPAAGPEEEIDEARVRDRYLVGILAPIKQDNAEEPDEGELEQGGADTVEDGRAEGGAPATRTLFPSSFGLSFCVALDAQALRVTARWGQYLKEQIVTGENSKSGWKRHPRGGVSQPIPLKAGALPKWVPDAECPEVAVTGIIRQYSDHWSVTVFLINGQTEPKRNRDEFWLFQPVLTIEDPNGAPIFARRRATSGLGKKDPAQYAEEQALEMLYRDRVEFAVGHGVSVHAEAAPGISGRAIRIRTAIAPTSEVARVTAPDERDFPKLANLVLDMKELAEADTASLPVMLEPLLTAYRSWIEEQAARIDTAEFAPYRDAALAAMGRCESTMARIREGLNLLSSNPQAADAFRFANRAMSQQRVRGMFSELVRRGENPDLAAIDIPRNRSWRPFQLAFILLNLPGITLLDHVDRVGEDNAVCDLLWFPTGGGKTEAYLGLAAYTMGLRRLQGTIEGRTGEDGVAVLMRYTLRLLTLQQFQRAAALICACEIIRRESVEKGDKRWGETPFRLGLWVGQKTTPNTTEQAAESVGNDRGQRTSGMPASSGSPHQLTNCPWCGSKLDAGRNLRVEKYPGGRGRTFAFCSDLYGRCPFTAKQSPDEGLPVLVVDEEIYRRLPAMLIATVDKFAQMPWNGKVQMLFGQVDGWCDRHGFRSPEMDDSDSHPRREPFPASRSVPRNPLRPPDLIIQDELHLISGPLGTLVGLYETAVDQLCSWTVGGRVVRPKVIASTATIRRAADQVNAIFLRKVNIFPPHGLDVADNFFALERTPSEADPGRLYLGICAPGRRLKAALIRVYTAFLSAGQQMYERYGNAADPYMTLVGYFNSLRELGGMRRLVDDDVRSRLLRMDRRGLARRTLFYDRVDELTSRKSSGDIPRLLDLMELQFDPAAEERRKKREPNAPERPLDVLLATNMVSVGVDVKRLGLMVVGGQPKATAEYIQATSRVGRSFPGIVCTVYNWARPRDLSHYETFEQYHATFYKHVEALSVTPFSPGALARGLTALLVSCVRLAGGDYNPNQSAGQLDRNHAFVQAAIATIARRAGLVGNGTKVQKQVEAELKQRIDLWLAEAQKSSGGRTLGYQDGRDGVTVGLLRKPGLERWDEFTCLNSLRDVEPTVGLILAGGGLDESYAPSPATAPDGGRP